MGANECRLAKSGERLIARNILADVCVTIQVPSAKFAALLRFSPPEERSVSRERLSALWDFAEESLTLVFQGIRSMHVAREAVIVSAIGGADVDNVTFRRGKQLALAVQRNLWRQGISLNGNDLGGSQNRLVWLESASGRLIVRSNVSRNENEVKAKAKTA